MKNRSIPFLYFFVALVLQTQALNDATAIVYKQQRDMVLSIIDHAQKRLPVVTRYSPAELSALNSIKQLLIEQPTPQALAYALDRLNNCINCKSFSASDSYTQDDIIYDCAVTQAKITELARSYFHFQLTLPGTIDHYIEEFLQAHNIDTTINLAWPYVKVGIGLWALHGAFNQLQSFLPHDTSTKKVTGSFKLGDEIIKEYVTSTAKTIIAALALFELKDSFNKFNKYTYENYERWYASFISKYRKIGYPVKPAKESFDTVRGYDDVKTRLLPLIDFTANLKAYRAADLRIARGYLFEGNLADTRRIALSIAGEVSKKSPAPWGVYEMHSSKLLSSSLYSILEECLEFGPTVLVIREFEWLYQQKEVEAKIYADIINRLGRYVASDSNYPVIICATTQDRNLIDHVLLEPIMFEVIKL